MICRSSTLPSSRNCPSARLLDLSEEEAAIDEISSMSGYESLEAVNILSTNEAPIIRKSAGVMSTRERSGVGGLVNPHYKGPEVEESEEERHAR